MTVEQPQLDLKMILLIDNNAVDLLAKSNIDPVAELHGTELILGCTRDLVREYLTIPVAAAAELAKAIAADSAPVGFFGFDGHGCLGVDQGSFASEDQTALMGKLECGELSEKRLLNLRTDLHLMALSKWHFVLTNNFRDAHWKQTPWEYRRVILWPEFEEPMKSCGFLAALRQFASKHSTLSSSEGGQTPGVQSVGKTLR
jgi:hypothetical protein